MSAVSFAVRTEVVGAGAFSISVSGEADLYTAPALEDELVGTICAGATRVVVDLTDVTFIDSTGLGVLVRAGRELRRVDGSLFLVVTDANVVRVFEMTALDRLFPIHATRDEALAAMTLARDGADGSEVPRLRP